MKTKKTKIFIFMFMCVVISAYAGDISTASGGEFDITSRTSFGFDLDHPYRYGLKQELTDFYLKLYLAPYQKLSNRVMSNDAVGFVNMTFFNLDLMTNEDLGYNAGVPDQKAYLERNRFQTGEFIAGIAKGNWIFQLNAGANEPFWSPWNKGIAFTNDKVKFSWACLDSMVDVKRTKKIVELKPQDEIVTQFQQDTCGATDQFGLSVSGPTVAALYNKEDLFGVNLKFATEYSYDSESISSDNANGIAAGIDAVVTPPAVTGLRILASVGGSYNYGIDANPDPIIAGTRIGYQYHFNDAISFEPFVGLDTGTKIESSHLTDAFEYETAAGITMRWPGQAGWYTDYILNKEGRVFPGMALCWSLYGKSDNSVAKNNSIKFTLFEPRGDEGVFYKLGSEMIVDVTNIGQKSWNMFATIYFDYEIPGIFKTAGKFIPWMIFCYDNVPFNTMTRQTAIKIDTGIKFDNIISNTIIGFSWDSGDLINDNADIALGYVKASVEIKY
jgi:hypothetical protein